MIFGLLLERKQIDCLFAFSFPLLIEHMLKKGKKADTIPIKTLFEILLSFSYFSKDFFVCEVNRLFKIELILFTTTF